LAGVAVAAGDSVGTAVGVSFTGVLVGAGGTGVGVSTWGTGVGVSVPVSTAPNAVEPVPTTINKPAHKMNKGRCLSIRPLLSDTPAKKMDTKHIFRVLTPNYKKKRQALSRIINSFL
jgi:hypothetical protein